MFLCCFESKCFSQARCVCDELGSTSSGPSNPEVSLLESLVAVPTARADEDEKGGFFAKMMQSSIASLGVTKNLSDLSSIGATNVMRGAILQEEEDPVLRYSSFMPRLIEQEFALARTKRYGLAIVRIANAARKSFHVLNNTKLNGNPFE
jgi:hypothetical protein